MIGPDGTAQLTTRRTGEVAGSPRAASLRANFGWAFAGNGIQAASQFAILVVLARLAGQEALGQVALATAVATPIFLLTGLQLRASQASDAAGLFRFADYFGVRVTGVVLGILTTVAMVAVAGYERTTALVILAYAGTKAVEALADVHYGYLQQRERMFPISRSCAMRGLLNVVVVGGVLWLGGGVVLAVVAFGVSSLAVLLAHDVRAAAPLLKAEAQQRLPRLHGPTARRIVRVSLPLGFVMLAVSLRVYLPRLFVEHSLGTAELGMFAPIAALATAGTLVVSALGQSATPRLARYFHGGDLRAFRRLVARLLLVGAGLGICGLLVAGTAGELILRLLFGPQFARGADLLVWVMAVAIIEYLASVLGYVVTAARRFAVQLPLFATTALACAAACSVLVPRHGLVGAAWGWGGAVLLELVALGVVLRRALHARARQG